MSDPLHPDPFEAYNKAEEERALANPLHKPNFMTRDEFVDREARKEMEARRGAEPHRDKVREITDRERCLTADDLAKVKVTIEDTAKPKSMPKSVAVPSREVICNDFRRLMFHNARELMEFTNAGEIETIMNYKKEGYDLKVHVTLKEQE